MIFQYSLKRCDILSPSYIVWKLVPDRRAGDEKSPCSKLGAAHGVFQNLRTRSNEAAHGEAETISERVYR